jgi:anti-anti-sigma factor
MLALHCRQVGDVTVVTCSGRLVVGEESTALERCLDTLIPLSPLIVLHLGAVDEIDSAGLGLLVRYLTRVSHGSGRLRVCAVSPKIDRALTSTRLKPVVQPYESEEHALVDAHRQTRDVSTTAGPQILCVDTSPDVLAYLRVLLKEAGYGVLTAGNLADALILLIGARPGVVVINPELNAASGTRSADQFRKHLSTRTVVELPAGFAAQEADAAAQHILDAIRASVT